MNGLMFIFASLSLFSDLPAPVAAYQEPDSPTKELDSILKDLMDLGEGSAVSASAHFKINETLN